MKTPTTLSEAQRLRKRYLQWRDLYEAINGPMPEHVAVIVYGLMDYLVNSTEVDE